MIDLYSCLGLAVGAALVGPLWARLPLSAGRSVGWLVLLVGASFLATLDREPLLRMVALCVFLLAAMKSLVWNGGG